MTHIHNRSVTVRFDFDVLESRKFNGLSKQSNGNALCDVSDILAYTLGSQKLRVVLVSIYIGVGLPALLVPDNPGNARALTRGTSGRTGSTYFILCMPNE